MPILIIRHVDYERLGNLPKLLKELKIPYKSISLSLGDPLPKLKDVSGIITMGGPMSAYEKLKHTWIEKEERFLRQAHKRGIPILGICLGGQILAQAFGAKVRKAPKEEIGWYRLTKTGNAQDPLLKGLRLPLLFELHYDAFDVPKGAVNLLRSAQTTHQMFRMGKNAYGLQFHPEADESMLRSVVKQYGKTLTKKDQRAILRDVKKRAVKGRRLFKSLLKRLLYIPK